MNNAEGTRQRQFTLTITGADGTQHTQTLSAPDFVTPTGGGYFLAPSISALDTVLSAAAPAAVAGSTSMIEVVSYPSALAQWNPQTQPFYLELFGETSPLVNMTYAEVLPAGPTDGSPQTAQAAPIYEYWWTIGHPGLPEHVGPFWERLGIGQPRTDLWQNLQDPAARVYLYFPSSGGWRIKELVATVKYLTPVHQQRSLWNQAAKDWQVISPLVEDVSKLASLANPVVGAGGSGTATILDTLAKLQITSIPQVDGFEWSVGKVTLGSADPAHAGVMQGVMWTLPKKMFSELGGRLTGSLALSFIPGHIQQGGTVASKAEDFPPQPKAILAHAVVYGPRDEIWAPGQREFIRLQVAPTLPPAKQ